MRTLWPSGSFLPLLLFQWALSPSASAQPVVIGNLPFPPETAAESTAVATRVNLSDAANADGELRSATFVWSAAPCPAAAAIKIFRPVSSDYFFTRMDLVAGTGVSLARWYFDDRACPLGFIAGRRH